MLKKVYRPCDVINHYCSWSCCLWYISICLILYKLVLWIKKENISCDCSTFCSCSGTEPWENSSGELKVLERCIYMFFMYIFVFDYLYTLYVYVCMYSFSFYVCMYLIIRSERSFSIFWTWILFAILSSILIISLLISLSLVFISQLFNQYPSPLTYVFLDGGEEWKEKI